MGSIERMGAVENDLARPKSSLSMKEKSISIFERVILLKLIIMLAMCS